MQPTVLTPGPRCRVCKCPLLGEFEQRCEEGACDFDADAVSKWHDENEQALAESMGHMVEAEGPCQYG